MAQSDVAVVKGRIQHTVAWSWAQQSVVTCMEHTDTSKVALSVRMVVVTALF